jgi:dihydropteroate synthase
MGIVNVTPDSFSDGGTLGDAAAAIKHARALAAQGATILDIGGESTRPGATPVPVEVELNRVRPVLAGLDAQRPAGTALSIDTRRAAVMGAALALGADIINDVSALTADRESLPVAAGSNAAVILMHMPDEPARMNVAPCYDDVALEVFDFLESRVEACIRAGIDRRRLIVDPGIGFGKTLAHNLELLRGLGTLHALGCPLLIGVSRKSFLGRLGGVALAKDRLAESLAGALWALSQGAQILRVHDVAETVRAAAVWRALADPTHATNLGQSTKN